MRSLPRGLVTFCFTDIEGSTQAFARLGPRFLSVLEEHRRIIREAVAAHGGAVVRTEGDGFFIAYADAAEAVRSVIDFQRALASHVWPEGGEVRVRVGLHAGHAEPSDDDYVAYAVHEAARIASAAHGGQSVVSATLAALTQGSLPSGVSLRDLGEHELKDIGGLRIFQLCATDLLDGFPPLRASRTVRGYIPTLPSSLVGRTDEIADLVAQMRTNRSVTVTGTGGVGKTRVAVEAARSLLGSRPDGVWFVDLSTVTDPEWIPDAVLAALGVVREPDMVPTEQLVTYLAPRDTLLVVDNCEHVIDACSALCAMLIARCPHVSILATSRESLGVVGELTWPLGSLQTVDGIKLFIDRAQAVGSTIATGDGTREALRQIVERLDGIPLAIELAASRALVLTPEQIAERLDDRFRLLTGGKRSVLARQRTLEATVGWSYDLLDEDERACLRFVSVFVGGFDLEAAEEVAGVNALDHMERLVAKSLVNTRLVAGRIRYRLLETIRHYAYLKLLDAAETEAARRRHLAYVVGLVERTADGLRDTRESDAAHLLTLENDNIRAALEWAFASGEHVAALRICAQMWMYWAVVGGAREGLGWLALALEHAGGVDPELVALARVGAAHLAWLANEANPVVEGYALAAVDHIRNRASGDERWYDAFVFERYSLTMGAGVPGAEIAGEALQRARRAGDAFVLAGTLLTVAFRRGEHEGPDGALASLAEAVAAARASGATSMLAYALARRSSGLLDAGQIEDAFILAQEAVAAAHRGPNVWFRCTALGALGEAMEVHGDGDAQAPLIEMLDLARERGLDGERGYAHAKLGWFHLGRGASLDAREHFESAGSLFAAVAGRRSEFLFEWAFARYGIAETAQALGARDEARSILGELLGLAEAVGGLKWTIAQLRNGLAAIDLDENKVDLAERGYTDAFRLLDGPTESAVREMQTRAASLRGLAAVALARGDVQRAAVLSGASAHISEPHSRSGRIAVKRNAIVLERIRGALGEDELAALWSRGEALDPGTLIDA